MSKTPPSVRVARWAAAAAAITGLFTVGNTFIEKRPWFLGGDEEKPAIVVSAPKPHPKVEHYESPTSIRFNIPMGGAEQLEVSPPISSVDMATSTAYSGAGVGPIMAMSVAPDMGWRINLLNFAEYRPIPFWIITGSLLFLGAYSLVEFLYSRRSKIEKVVIWTSPNMDVDGPDNQK